MEQADRGVAARSQNVVHVLPRTTEALERIVSAPLERIDAASATLQLVIVTPDAESAVAIAETVHALTGAQGIEVVPVTSANRAARLLADRPVHAVAGPASELAALVERSALKLDTVRTVVLAWIDSDESEVVEATAISNSLDALFSEVPKTAARVLVVRRTTPAVDAIIEQHLRNARRIWGADAPSGETVGRIVPSGTPLQFVSVASSSRPAALRRLLDELDPPSAAIVVRDVAAEADAVQTVRSLGYRRGNDPIRVTRYGNIGASHTIILYDSPVMPTEVSEATSASPVQLIALATPRDMVALHELVETLVPLSLEGPGVVARSRESAIRAELTAVLAQGSATRELLTLEPLLDRYDGIEIAAAALRLLESERQQRAKKPVLAIRKSEAPAREERDDRPRRESSDSRPPRGFGGPRREGSSDRPPRERSFGGARGASGGSGGSGGSDRPPRGAKPRDNARNEGDERRERNLGRGPRSGTAPGRGDSDKRGAPPRRPRPFER